MSWRSDKVAEISFGIISLIVNDKGHADAVSGLEVKGGAIHECGLQEDAGAASGPPVCDLQPRGPRH